MSLPNLFAWLLRGDVRESCASAAGATSFCSFLCWWAVFGFKEYPRAWSLTEAQADILMEQVEVEGRYIPRILAYLLDIHPTLRSQIALDKPGAPLDLLCWYRLWAPSIYPGLPALPYPLLEQTHIKLGKDVSQFAQQVNAQTPLKQSPSASKNVDELRGKLVSSETLGWPPSATGRIGCHAISQAFGVNLIGFARAGFGLGEDLRCLALALDSADVPYSVIDAPHLNQDKFIHGELDSHISQDLVYDISIYCMSPFDVASLLLEEGWNPFACRYKIGYLAWELPTFPPEWRPVLSLFDEIWANSKYCASSLARSTDVSVRSLDPTVDISPYEPYRGDDPRPEELKRPFRFVHPFDPYSSFARKNPVATLEAFNRAFPDRNEPVELVFRINLSSAAEADSMDENMRRLILASKVDRRIVISRGVLRRRDALNWIRESNCLVSPHRAEGFGRNIIEALLLGASVLATGFSGCTDFLEIDEVIDWEPSDIPVNGYPFSTGQWWANPDVAQLASKMRQLFEAHISDTATYVERRRRRAGQANRRYGRLTTGERYRAILESVFRNKFSLTE